MAESAIDCRVQGFLSRDGVVFCVCGKEPRLPPAINPQLPTVKPQCQRQRQRSTIDQLTVVVSCLRVSNGSFCVPAALPFLSGSSGPPKRGMGHDPLFSNPCVTPEKCLEPCLNTPHPRGVVSAPVVLLAAFWCRRGVATCRLLVGLPCQIHSAGHSRVRLRLLKSVRSTGSLTPPCFASGAIVHLHTYTAPCLAPRPDRNTYHKIL